MRVLVSFIVCIGFLYSNSFKDIFSYKANFVQSIVNPSGSEVLYKGSLYIKKPSYIKWIYNSPVEKVVYIKNDKVTILEPELEQVILTTLDKEIDILNLLKKSKKISKNQYEAKYNNTLYNITIIDDKLTKISYEDELENSITINFDTIEQNIKLPDYIFLCDIPYEYDIIRK